MCLIRPRSTLLYFLVGEVYIAKPWRGTSTKLSFVGISLDSSAPLSEPPIPCKRGTLTKRHDPPKPPASEH